MREPREFMREILDKNPPRVGRQSWGFMRRILDKNPPIHGRQIHKDRSILASVRVQKWIPDDPRNERTCAHMWRKVGSGGP